jgi:3-hydroxyisobutyrate dehydrogenase-like beta-hydroxyacid dehydrogenase
MQVGFIGLGTMGSSMALNTLKGGHALVVHDINRDAQHRTSRPAPPGPIRRVP